MSRDLARNLDDLAHAEPVAASQVADQLRVLFQPIEREQMRRRQVVDVNVVADASSVLGWIVRAEDGNRRSFAQRHLKHKRNQMRLRIVRLAAVGGGSGGVEVTQAGVSQSV